MWLLERLWSWTICLLSNSRGFAGEGDNDDDADNSEGTGDADNSEGTGGGGKEDDQEGEEDGSGEEDEADKPDEETLKLFGGDEELAKQFKGNPAMVAKSYKELMGKHKPMEMESSDIKNWAKKMGLNARYDASGRFMGFTPGDKKGTQRGRERRFTEEHRKGLQYFFRHKEDPEGNAGGKKFLDTMSLYIQDLIDDAIEAREAQGQQALAFRQEEIKAEKMIASRYPDADPDSEDFPEGGTPLYNRATEIYRSSDDYQSHPRGQLYAVLDAALELGIQPKAISEAKKKGREEGAANKRILSRVGGGAGAGAGTGGLKKGQPSMEAFINMTPQQRREHQEKEFKKRQGG